jgi:SHS2 domain-containing protein
MKKFEIINHTADIGIVAYGEDLKEVFANIAYGMSSLITDLEKIEEKIEEKISLTSSDLEELLIGFLNELLYIFEIKKLIFKNFFIDSISENFLKVICKGNFVKENAIFREIKSATYHLLKIEKNKYYRIQVFFDL